MIIVISHTHTGIKTISYTAYYAEYEILYNTFIYNQRKCSKKQLSKSRSTVS